ncbi:MAG: glycosyltransferase family A protein [Pseudomonadota bacterium]
MTVKPQKLEDSLKMPVQDRAGWLDHGDVVADLVSIIIPTYNRRHMVGEAIESALSQTWDNIEVVVIDDGSTDDTVEMIEKRWGKTHNRQMRLLQQPNQGPAAARNAAMRASRGDYLMFLDSDDLLLPDAVAELMTALKNGTAQYAMATVAIIDSDNQLLDYPIVGVPVQPQNGNIFVSFCITNSALYKRSLISAAGAYNRGLLRGEDNELHWRVAVVGGDGEVVDTVVGVRRIHNQCQLSVDLDETDRLDIIAQMLEAFRVWALDSHILHGHVLHYYLRQLLQLATEYGAEGNFDRKAKILSVLNQQAPGNQPIRTMAKLLRPNVRTISQSLNMVFKLGRYFPRRERRLRYRKTVARDFRWPASISSR